MKINQYTGQQIKVYDKKVRDVKAESVKQNGIQNSKATTGDTINVSSQARLLGVARQGAAEAPDIRQTKVKDLKERVRNGTYKPDVRKTAMNIVREDIDFLK